MRYSPTISSFSQWTESQSENGLWWSQQSTVLTAVVVAPCWSTEPVPSTMSFRTLTSKPQLDSWSFFRSRDNIEFCDSLVVEAETWWGTREFTGCWASCLLQVKITWFSSQESILWRDRQFWRIYQDNQNNIKPKQGQAMSTQRVPKSISCPVQSCAIHPLQRMHGENCKRSSESHCWHHSFVQVCWDNTRVSTSMRTSCLVTRNREHNYQATRSNYQATSRWKRTREACLSPLTQDRCAALDWEQCTIG